MKIRAAGEVFFYAEKWTDRYTDKHDSASG